MRLLELLTCRSLMDDGILKLSRNPSAPESESILQLMQWAIMTKTMLLAKTRGLTEEQNMIEEIQKTPVTEASTNWRHHFLSLVKCLTRTPQFVSDKKVNTANHPP